MILQRANKETWIAAAVRYGRDQGVSSGLVYQRYAELVASGYSERRAAYLTLAEQGVVDDVGV